MELKDAQKKGWPCDIIAKFESASPRHEDTCEFSATFGTVFDNVSCLTDGLHGNDYKL